MPRSALFDGNRRRQTFDRFDMRLLQLTDELAGVGTQALHIAALPFGIDRVHGKRAFTAAAGTAEDGELVARNFHAHITQIVFASTFDDNVGGLFDASRLVGLERAVGLPLR